MENTLYPARFDYAEDGITITFRDLPGTISEASSEDGAYH